MNTNGIDFYNPLSLVLNGAKLQDFVDAVLAEKYNKLEVDGFTFNEDLLTDFTYEQVQRELKMDVMASYVDLDSSALPVSVEGDVIGTGKIPRMKSVEYYNEDKLRKLAQLADRRSVDRAEVIKRAGIALGEIFIRLRNRHANALTYQRHQVVSTGKFTLTDSNNPLGINGVTFSNHVPSSNITTLANAKRWWTNSDKSTEGGSADPINDLKAMVKAARNKGVTKVHFEVENNFMDDILGHSKVKDAIKANLFYVAGTNELAAGALLGVTRDAQINALGAIVGAPFKCIDSIVAVEKFNSTTKRLERNEFSAFASNVCVLVPDGGIGEILTVEPILLDGGYYAFWQGRKMAITIGKDYVKKCLSYNSEMTSLVVPNVPNYMWYLKPCEA